MRVYSPLGKKEQGQFALECGVKALTFYKDLFEVPYPLKKYDMIAIADISVGAMENWGLVTYREVRILVDPVNTSAASKVNTFYLQCSVLNSTKPYRNLKLCGFFLICSFTRQSGQIKIFKLSLI